MLRPPYTRYNRLAVYYLDRRDVPAIEDQDFIGCWVEDDSAILFFHCPKDDLVIANLYKGLLLKLFADHQFRQAKMYMISGFIPAMEGALLAGLPSEGLRILFRGSRKTWRLWLLQNRRRRR